MKLSRGRVLLIIMGILVIALVGLNTVHSQQVSEQNKLNDELTLTQSKLKAVQLEQLSARKAELEKQLTQAAAQSHAVKAMLSQPISSFNVTTVVFDIAKANTLEVTKINLTGPTSTSLEGVPCSVVSLAVRLEGDVPNLVSSVTKLNSSFPTGVVKSVRITIPEATSGKKASADLELAVYTRQEK